MSRSSAPAPPGSRPRSSPAAQPGASRPAVDGARSPAPRSSSAAAAAATSPTASSPSATSGAAGPRSSAGCCARFPSQTRSTSFASSASRCTRRPTASCSPTPTGRATCSTRCSRAGDAAAASLRAGHARGSTSMRRGPRLLARDVARRSRAARVVLATGGRRCRRPAATAPATDRAARSGTRSSPTTPALAPLLLDGAATASPSRRCRGVAQSTSSSRSGWTARSAARLTGSLLWTHFGVSGPVALNASRHWHRARARAAPRARHPQLPSRETFDEVDARWLAASRAPAAAPSVQTRWRRDLPGVGRGAPAPRAGDRPGDVPLAELRATIAAGCARAGRVAAAGHRHARLQLRRGHRRRRRARPRSIRRRWSRGCVRGCFSSARSSTWTAASAASTSSGRGRAPPLPPAALARPVSS